MHPPEPSPVTVFKAARQLNGEEDQTVASSRSTLSRTVAGRCFSSDGLVDKLAMALGERRCLPTKEFVESVEMFARIRRRMKARCVVDLCAGHGLLGILFALYERQVERVVLIDEQQPSSHDQVLDGAMSVGDWVGEKVEYRQQRLREVTDLTSLGSPSLVATHACGDLTDLCLDLAVEGRLSIAAMPCCYAARTCHAPAALRRTLGLSLATDIDRTYRLEAAGYRVAWSQIPEAVTPMNRILMATPRR